MNTSYPRQLDWQRLLLFSCIAMLVGSSGCGRKSAAPAEDAARQGRNITVIPSVVDFGEVPIGKSVSTTVRLVNSSDSEIEIGDIRPSCGCTVVDIPTKRILPQGYVTLTVNMKPVFSPGKKDSKVCVQIKGTKPLFAFIPIRETVIQEWTCVPTRLEETFAEDEESKDFTLSVYRHSDNSEKFNLKSTNKRIEVLSREIVKSKEGFMRDEVQIRVHCPHDVPCVSGDVRFVAVKDGKVLLAVPVACYRGNHERLSPPLIALGTVSRGEKHSAFVSGPAATIGKLVGHSIVDGTPVFGGQFVRLGNIRVELQITIAKSAPHGFFRIPLVAMGTNGKIESGVEVVGTVE